MTDSTDLAAHVADTRTVTIITTRANGDQVATPIWAVAVDDVVYVRSAYAEKAAWNRRARSGRPVAMTLADGRNAERDASTALQDPREAVTAVLLPADAAEQVVVDAAYRAKYGDEPENLQTVLTDEARSFTLRLASA